MEENHPGTYCNNAPAATSPTGRLASVSACACLWHQPPAPHSLRSGFTLDSCCTLQSAILTSVVLRPTLLKLQGFPSHPSRLISNGSRQVQVGTSRMFICLFYSLLPNLKSGNACLHSKPLLTYCLLG